MKGGRSAVRRILRTHMLRTTWHLVTREDIRWMLAVTSPRVGDAQRLAYIVMSAELHGLICSGAMRGAQHAYAVLDERVPPGRTYERDEALTEIAVRFFAGHGPASLRDFTRWSSQTVADARTAVAAAVGDRLDSLDVEGETLFLGRSSGDPRVLPLAAYRRTLVGSRLTVETDLAPGLGKEQLAAVRSAVDRLTAFMGHDPHLEP